MAQSYDQPISAAIFCPQNKPPKVEYMADIRRFIRGNPLLQPFEQAILDLPKAWETYSLTNTSIAGLKTGPEYTKNIHDWLADNAPLPIPKILSGILALPLLTIIQVVQYFQYLALRGIDHAGFLEEVGCGGIQGFCGGLLPALAIAAAKDEAEVVRNAAKSLRIALGIGAYGELGDDEDMPGPTTLVLRAKQEGQAEQIVAMFPEVNHHLPLCRLFEQLKQICICINDELTRFLPGTYFCYYRSPIHQCRRSSRRIGASEGSRRGRRLASHPGQPPGQGTQPREFRTLC